MLCRFDGNRASELASTSVGGVGPAIKPTAACRCAQLSAQRSCRRAAGRRQLYQPLRSGDNCSWHALLCMPGGVALQQGTKDRGHRFFASSCTSHLATCFVSFTSRGAGGQCSTASRAWCVLERIADRGGEHGDLAAVSSRPAARPCACGVRRQLPVCRRCCVRSKRLNWPRLSDSVVHVLCSRVDVGVLRR